MTTARLPHVAINARAMCFPPHGSGKYVERITQILQLGGCRLTLLAPTDLDQHYGVPEDVEVRVESSSSLLRWEEFLLPQLLDQLAPDVYFAATGRGIPARRRRRTVYLLGLLDVIPWRYPRLTFWEPPRFWTLRHEAWPQLISWARAHDIWTISRTSRDDILRFTPNKRVTGLPYPMAGRPLRPQMNPHPQFAYVGGSQHRKRTDNLLRAFARLLPRHPGHQLVFIGRGYTREQALARELGISAAVRVTGRVSDAERDRTINESIAFVYPSHYEGWGLGIGEALIAGTPVIAGTGGAQTEVAGAAMLAVDPDSPADIAHAMAKMLKPEVRQRLLAAREREVPRLLDPSVTRRVVNHMSALAARRLAPEYPGNRVV